MQNLRRAKPCSTLALAISVQAEVEHSTSYTHSLELCSGTRWHSMPVFTSYVPHWSFSSKHTCCRENAGCVPPRTGQGRQARTRWMKTHTPDAHPVVQHTRGRGGDRYLLKELSVVGKMIQLCSCSLLVYVYSCVCNGSQLCLTLFSFRMSSSSAKQPMLVSTNACGASVECLTPASPAQWTTWVKR